MFEKSPFKLVQLGDVVAKKETRDPRQNPSNIIKYVDISSVSNKRLSIVKAQSIIGKDAPSRARKVIRFRDVIFATTRPYLKSIACVPKNLDNQICSTGFCVLRATEVIEPEWIFFCTSSDQFINQITPLMRGANYPAVTDKDILGALIPLPALFEQRRIIAHIKECIERVEEIEALRAENSILVGNLYKSCLTDLYTEMISGDSKKEFKDIVADTKLGLVRSKKEQSENRSFPYVKMQDISNNGTLNTSSLINVDANDAEIEKFSLRSGDFLFNTRNSYELVGKTAIAQQIPKKTLFNNNIMRIRFKDIVLPSFVNHLFQHGYVRSQLENRKNKTTSVCAIYWKGLASIKIPVPSIHKQNIFVDEIGTIFHMQNKILKEIEDSISKHKMLRESILYKAFSGGL